MSCISPVVIRSKAMDARPNQFMSVPCGKCIGCLKDRQDSWIYRIEREQSVHSHSLFVTLTYDPKHIPLLDLRYDGRIIRYCEFVRNNLRTSVCSTLDPTDLQKFFKRLRKRLKGVELKYFACGEYGEDEFGTKRPHYHAAIMHDSDPSKVENAIFDSWKLGNVRLGPLIPNRIVYVTKYILKQHEESKQFDCQINPFQRASKGLGINGYLKDVSFFKINIEMLPTSKGNYIRRPRYFKKKFDYTTDFKTTTIELNNYERYVKERERFKRFVQDYSLTHGTFTLEEVTKAYDRANDPQEIQRVYELNANRKKNF